MKSNYQKFTDEELIKYHKDGFNDKEIGEFLNVHRVTIRYRRCKLGLLSNTPKKVTKERLLETRRKLNKSSMMRNKRNYNEIQKNKRHIKYLLRKSKLTEAKQISKERSVIE